MASLSAALAQSGRRDALHLGGLWRFSVRLLALSVGLIVLSAAQIRAEQVTVFAAASLKDALEEIAQGFVQTQGAQVAFSFAGSSALARQIEHGAPADLFISANPAWMDHLEEAGFIAPQSRVSLLSNRLVVIGQAGEPAREAFQPRDLLGAGRLSMALVDAVPAGLYGKAAFESLGLWGDLAPQVVQTDNVRAAMALVALGAVPYGVVYASDVQAEPRVQTLYTFQPEAHPPIVYPLARLTGSTQQSAQSFWTHLQSDAAQQVFARHGFSTLAPRTQP